MARCISGRSIERRSALYRTAQELHLAICKHHRPYSLRAVYKELEKLIENEIVDKAKGSYSLNLFWLFSLSRFTRLALEEAFSPCALSTFVPEEKQQNKWQFSDLHSLDRFWMQLLFSLIRASPTGVQFNWLPHYWFHLVSSRSERIAIIALDELEKESYTIFGSGTYLERLDEGSWKRKTYQWKFPPHKFDLDRSKYIAVVDHFVITVRLDKGMQQSLDHMFASVNSQRKAECDVIQSVLSKRCRATLTLENSRRKSLLLRKKFCNAFRIDDPLIDSDQATAELVVADNRRQA